MTEAQRAHLRILERTPRERIITHEAAPPGQKGLRPQPEISARRRKWIAANASRYTNKEMADELGIALGSVKKHLLALGIATRSSKRGRPRKSRV